MKIAIPAQKQTKTSTISPVFGRATYFLIYDQAQGAYEFKANQAKQRPGGAGVQASQLLVDEGVQVVIAPQVGGNALQVLKGAQIKLYRSKEGTLEDNVQAFLHNELVEHTGGGQ